MAALWQLFHREMRVTKRNHVNDKRPESSRRNVGPQRKRVLVVAYKIERSKGSEDGSGYNIIARIASRSDVELTLISRVNNIERLADDKAMSGVRLIGVDVPRPLGSIKRGGRGIIAYYYLWQMYVGWTTRRLSRNEPFDVLHQLNFHTDWAPHFLYDASARIVWGPVAHHKRIPRTLLPPGPKHWLTENLRWLVKCLFWHCDPWLRRAVRRSDVILYADGDLAPPFRRVGDRVRFQPYGGSALIQGKAGTRNHHDKGTNEFSILTVGRFVPLKGLHLAIEAVAQLCREQPEIAVRYVLVGSGPERAALAKQVQSIGLSGVVEFVDWVCQDELPSYYARADVFLYPSFEAQGLVVSEAMECGLPIVCLSDTGPAALAGGAGRLVSRHAPQQVVMRLVEALRSRHEVWLTYRDRPESDSDRHETRLQYERRLTWDRIADGIIGSYELDPSEKLLLEGISPG